MKISKIAIKLVFIMLLSYTARSYSQDYIVACTRNSYVYLGIPNHLHISYNGEYDSLFLKTDNGTMSPSDNSNCNWTPAFVDNNNYIYLYKIYKEDTVLIDTAIFSVFELPEPIIQLVDKFEGAISKDKLINSPVIRAELDDKYLIGTYLDGLGIRLKSFSFIVVRNDSVKYLSKKNSSSFSEDDKRFFLELENKDRIVFFDIIVLTPYLKEDATFIKPAEFIIK